MRKQSGDAKDTPKDPLDFYPILEKPTLNDSQPKTVRFNLPNGPDREWESQVDQQASVSDFAAVHPNAHPLIGVQPMCRSNSAVRYAKYDAFKFFFKLYLFVQPGVPHDDGTKSYESAILGDQSGF